MVVNMRQIFCFCHPRICRTVPKIASHLEARPLVHISCSTIQRPQARQILTRATTLTPTPWASQPTLHQANLIHQSRPVPEKLRVLFCGTDTFSSTVLTHLLSLQASGTVSIDVITVVTKPSNTPISLCAAEHQLSCHHIRTFTGWTPPVPYDLIIAVSFGLLIPPRIIQGATYGGINVHPSLLPELHGPAPIHGALRQGLAETGVTLQTLHPSKFDGGTIIAQSPPVRIRDEIRNIEALTRELAKGGGELLRLVVETGLYAPPVATVESSRSKDEASYAPKVNEEDLHVSFEGMGIDELTLRDQAYGYIWTTYKGPGGTKKAPQRAKLGGLRSIPSTLVMKAAKPLFEGGVNVETGNWTYFRDVDAEAQSGVASKIEGLAVKSRDLDLWITSDWVQIEGGKRVPAGEWARSQQKQYRAWKFG